METLTNARHRSDLLPMPGMTNSHAACEGHGRHVVSATLITCAPVVRLAYCPRHHPTAYAQVTARHRAVR